MDMVINLPSALVPGVDAVIRTPTLVSAGWITILPFRNGRRAMGALLGSTCLLDRVKRDSGFPTLRVAFKLPPWVVLDRIRE